MADHVFLSVRVTPRASRDEVTGWEDDELRVRLRAPPVDGQANESLRRFIAKRLGLPLSSVTIASGATVPRKRLRVEGVDPATINERLKV